jgi:RluA family pseudouridine synthase
MYVISTNKERVVEAYVHDFTTKCPMRWHEQTVGQIYATEFTTPTTFPFFVQAVRLGLVTVNDDVITTDSHVLHAGDVLVSVSHRHEPPIAYVPAKDMICFDDGDVLAINKPATCPIHPCGGYNHNSALMILHHELGLSNLHTIHRLDRMTSGICLLARTAQSARKFQAGLAKRQGYWTSKTYVARVKGKFPISGDEFDVSEPASSWVSPTTIQVSSPIRVVDYKKGVHEVHPEGKLATSLFTFACYDADTNTSLVTCEPITGRTHQLRLHLQQLGFPITNDYAYGGSDEFAPSENDDDVVAAASSASTTTINDSVHDRAVACCAICTGGQTPLPNKRPSGIYLHAHRFRLFKTTESITPTTHSSLESSPPEYDIFAALPPWALSMQQVKI